MQVIKYDKKYRDSVIELMVHLQDHERALSADRPPSSEVSEKQLDYLLAACTASVGRIYIAVIESRAVGIIVVFQDQEHEGTQHVYPEYRRFCLVSDLVVSEAYKGKGVALALMEKVYEYTRLCTKSLEISIPVESAAINARRPRWQSGMNSPMQPGIWLPISSLKPAAAGARELMTA